MDPPSVVAMGHFMCVQIRGGMSPADAAQMTRGPFLDMTGIVTTAQHDLCPVPGMANTHIPNDTLVWPTAIHVQGIAWASAIWAVAAHVDSPARRAARLGGTGAHTGQTQTARHQRSRC